MDTWIPIITGLFTLLGAIAGGSITVNGNRKIQKDKLSNEISRELEKDRNEKEIAKVEIYNNVLKINGEHINVTHIGGHYTDFEIEIYEKEIRSLLYQKLHLIDRDIALILYKIDDTIAACNFREEITQEESAYLSSEYWKLIDSIRKYVDNFRKNYYS